MSRSGPYHTPRGDCTTQRPEVRAPTMPASRREASRRGHELRAVLGGQPGRGDLARDGLRVVGHALDAGAHPPVLVAVEDREGAARVAVLGLADRAAVDEQDGAELVDPGLVRVPEDQRRGRLDRGQALVEAGGLVLEEVLVDLARRAVDEVDLLVAEREPEVGGQL